MTVTHFPQFVITIIYAKGSYIRIWINWIAMHVETIKLA